MDDTLELRKQNLKYYEDQEKSIHGTGAERFYADAVVSSNNSIVFSATF